MATKPRAQPMPPEARREAILDAVIPLLIEHGANVTTSQMAAAAGIAEGTIFRVFPDKTELLHAAVRTSLDPTHAMERMAAIDPGVPFEAQLREAAEILIERSDRVYALVGALRSFPKSDPKRGEGAQRAAIEANRVILRGLSGLFEMQAPVLTLEPVRAAVAFRGILYAAHFPLTDPADRMTVDEAVAITLRGVTKPGSTK